MLPASKPFHCKYLFHLTKKQLTGFQKICVSFSVFHHKSRADNPNSPPQICLHSPHFDQSAWALMSSGLGISLWRFSSTSPVPSDLQMDASHSPRLTHGDSWCLEQSNPDLLTPTPLLWCCLCHPSDRAEPQAAEQTHRSALLAPESWWFLLAAQAQKRQGEFFTMNYLK